MKSKINSLTEIQSDILKNRILDQPKRPFGFSFAALYGDMDITKYSEDEIQIAIEDLVEKELFEKRNDGSYIFSRQQFLDVKSYFKLVVWLQEVKKASLILIKFIWKHFIITILAAALTAYITTVITLKVKEIQGQEAKEINKQPNSTLKDNGKVPEIE
jgi:hypothetical protein